MKQKKLMFNFFVNRNWSKLTDTRKRAKILADNRKSHHPIETLVKACMTFLTFVESRGYAFLNPNTIQTIHNPASNNRRILIAAVLHFVAAVEEHKD